ncbi:MAG TPA: GIY-YIG nuclease family protein [Gammaproteobacteria bacterium]|nr:GIY-YIG nuclease family protein [Gammaproteobacteria bacterium]
MSRWNTYIVRCADHTLYTGVCTDVDRRVEEHNSSTTLGARYTRSRRPVTLVYSERVTSRSEACIRESEIKKLSKKQKLELIRRTN